MNRIAFLALCIVTVACAEEDAFDTGDSELEASAEVHEIHFESSKSIGTSSKASSKKPTVKGPTLSMAGNSCRGIIAVSDECCDLTQDVLDGDTSHETCQDLQSECPTIGFPSHNQKVFDALLDCMSPSDDSDGGVIDFP
jgi:hypothetical protein